MVRAMGAVDERCASRAAFARAALVSAKALSLYEVKSTACLGFLPLRASYKDLGHSGDEIMVKVHHAKELLQGFDRERAWELSYRLHFGWEWDCTILCDSVPQEVNGRKTKVALLMMISPCWLSCSNRV